MGWRIALPFSTLSSKGGLMSTPPCWRYSMWGVYTDRFVFDKKKYHCAACTEKDVCDIRNKEATYKDRDVFINIVIAIIALFVLGLLLRHVV